MNTLLEADGKPMWLVTSDCTNLIWELGRLPFDNFANKKIAHRHNLKEKPKKKNDHACDSLRYFIMSRPELVLPERQQDDPVGNPLGFVTAASPIQKVDGWVAQDLPHNNRHDNSEYTQWLDDSMGGEW
jgi:hypothetical protein